MSGMFYHSVIHSFSLNRSNVSRSKNNKHTFSIHVFYIAMFLVTSPIVINVPTTGLLAVDTMHAIVHVQWLENLNIKRNMTSMFVQTKKHRYTLVRHTL